MQFHLEKKDIYWWLICRLHLTRASNFICGLRLWGQFEWWSNSGKPHQRWLTLVKWTFRAQATDVGAIPAVCTLPHNLQLLLHCLVVTNLHIFESFHCIVISQRHTCTIIMLLKQHHNKRHLSGGWIILAKRVLRNEWTKFERTKTCRHRKSVRFFTLTWNSCQMAALYPQSTSDKSD